MIKPISPPILLSPLIGLISGDPVDLLVSVYV